MLYTLLRENRYRLVNTIDYVRVAARDFCLGDVMVSLPCPSLLWGLVLGLHAPTRSRWTDRGMKPGQPELRGYRGPVRILLQAERKRAGGVFRRHKPSTLTHRNGHHLVDCCRERLELRREL